MAQQVKIYAGSDTKRKWEKICKGFSSNTAAFAVIVENYFNQITEGVMATQTVFARGSEWSDTALYDGWGDNVTQEQAKALGNLVVERFEELAAKAGDSSIYWQPATSEVIGEVYGETTHEHGMWDPINPIDADLDDLRNQAVEEVWAAGIGEDSPMATQVREILEDEG
jgi:hypothetical protein